jgi:division protein CdvB (Snf7/Vps24/ESCRT-III family)
LNWKIWKGKVDDKPSRDRIVYAIKSIEIYRKELENTKKRVEARCDKLFNVIVKALEAKDQVRAKIYAVEHSELKRVMKVVTVSELALSQIIIRLESICETGDVITQVSSAFKIVRKTGDEIKSIMPQIESTVQEVNEVLTDTMSSLQRISPDSPIVLDVSQGEDILESAKKYVEEQIDTLEEPTPESLQTGSEEYSLDRMRNIALMATGEDGDEGFKATLLNAPHPSSEQNHLDHKVLDYIHSRDTFNAVEIAANLYVPVNKVEQSMFRLASAGKIRIKEVD